MKGEYDVIEDVRIKKNYGVFSNRLIKIVIGTLIFLILCGLCFNLVYLLSFNNIEKNDDITSVNKEGTNRIYIIEQKLRKDLEKMKSNIKNK